MEKNWLIRTKSNHILGPVSKEKVLELYQNGSIKADDEVCSGNGFWFFIREEDKIARFLLGNEVQGFNPISEAKDVLTSSSHHHPVVDKPVEEDITLIGGINTSLLKSEDKTPPPTIMSNVMGEPKPAIEAPKPAGTSTTTPGPAPKKKANVISRTSLKSDTMVKPSLKKQNFIQYIAIICFLILFLLIYFRKTIIRSIFHGEVTMMSLLMPSAHAQEVIPSKKKTSLSARSN
jgi:hypothetical protein